MAVSSLRTFSPAVAQAVDDLVRQGIVSADRRETQGGDKEFVLYDLAEYTRKSNLRDLGVSGAIQLRIQADMKRYSRDLPRLLDYVYFRTAPMADATPGQVLDFSGCVKMHSEDFRAVEMRRLRPKAIKNVRIRLRELIRERAEREMAQQGPFDDVYYSAIEVLNGEPAETGLTGKAKIKV